MEREEHHEHEQGIAPTVCVSTLHVARDGPVYRVRWWCANGTRERARWRSLLGDFKWAFDVDERYFDAGAWCVPLSCAARLHAWADAHFERHAQQWDDDEEPASFAGRRSQSSAELERAYAALYLVPAAPPWAAEAVYRAAIKRVHPDVGGDHGATVALTRAIAVIREHGGRRSA